MARIKLVLEYDGTDYVGWQPQANGPSLHARVERAVRELVGEQVAIVAAARTDAGVHAAGQVACFDTTRTFPLKAYSMGLNKLLPADISVVSASEVAPAFDPRRDSRGKRYRYLISNRRSRSPLRRRTHWELFKPLDLSTMQAAAPALVGKHDFSAFRASDCQASHPVRELRILELSGQSGSEIVIQLEGTAFLKHMARNIVGTLVEVGKGRQPAQWVRETLESRDRTRSGPTAPARGLTLMEVIYAGAGETTAQDAPDGGGVDSD
jgi:tRNA pseudouridine38-40 synthase